MEKTKNQQGLRKILVQVLTFHNPRVMVSTGTEPSPGPICYMLRSLDPSTTGVVLQVSSPPWSQSKAQEAGYWMERGRPSTPSPHLRLS